MLKFIGRGEPGASEIMVNLFDADYLMKHELVFIGSPDTVAKKIHATALSGLFNVFMSEFNFSDLPEADLHALDPPVWREGHSRFARLRAILMQKCLSPKYDGGNSAIEDAVASTAPEPIPDALRGGRC